MKRYFSKITKPKWYIILAGIAFFATQCMAIINLCYQFGGGYYLIIPLQVAAGYLDVAIFIFVQKDVKNRDFIPLVLISLVLGAGTALAIFVNLFTSVPAFKGVVYGVMMISAISMAFYVLIRTVKTLVEKRKKAK